MGSPPIVKEMLAVVRAWVASNYPGCDLDYIEIHTLFRGREMRPITLNDAPVIPPRSEPKPFNDEETVAEDGDSDERGPGLAPCARDILTTLRESERPMTKALLLEQMGRKNREWSERTVDKYLKALMEDGTIENPPDARPRGYRLAE